MLESLKNAFEGVWTGVVRTYVPWIVGLIVGWLTTLGIPLDDEFKTAITLLITTLAGAIWYLLVRVVEKFKPKAGLLLGIAKTPVYTSTEAAPVVQAIADQVELDIEDKA